MDNTDANSAGNSVDSAGQQLHVIKIYPLDGKPIAESQYWVAVAQIQNEVAKRLFLRDGQQHRLISTETALSLLSDENKKDLSAILKFVSNKGGSSTGIKNNSIEQIDHYISLSNIIHQTTQHQLEQASIGQQTYNATAGGIHLGGEVCRAEIEDRGRVLNTTSNSAIVIQSMVLTAQLRSWGAIKITGTEYFKRQIWLEAAARGMFIEGYIHTEADRHELFKRTPESARSNIRAEYKPAQFQTKNEIEKAEKLAMPAKQALAAKYIQNNVDLHELSEEDLNFLLARVQQNEMSNENSNPTQTNYQAPTQHTASSHRNVNQVPHQTEASHRDSSSRDANPRDSARREESARRDSARHDSHLENMRSEATHHEHAQHDTIHGDASHTRNGTTHAPSDAQHHEGAQNESLHHHKTTYVEHKRKVEPAPEEPINKEPEL
ncbi:MAG: LPD7 domain-containing protein [Methylotenera sp.]